MNELITSNGMGQEEQTGLRERKKRRTRELIARNALDLFERQGYAATTIAQIAAASDVSPRTVSTYFPAKEDLVFIHYGETVERLRTYLAQRPDEQGAMAALREWLLAEREIWSSKHDDEELAQRQRVIEADPGLRAHKHAQIGQFEEILTEAFAKDLGCGPAELEPRMAAAATIAVFDMVSDERDGDTRPPTFEEQVHVLDRVLTFVTAGVQALRADS